jgi:hypothetical protein
MYPSTDIVIPATILLISASFCFSPVRRPGQAEVIAGRRGPFQRPANREIARAPPFARENHFFIPNVLGRESW